jgi:hypothetical protein
VNSDIHHFFYEPTINSTGATNFLYLYVYSTMFTYQYTIIEKFTNGLNLAKLDDTIRKDNLITTILLNARSTVTIVYLDFENELSSDELTELTTIINNHNNNPIAYSTKTTVNPYILYSKISVPTYMVCSSFIYDASVYNTIPRITILAQMVGSGSYSIKINDRTNNNVLQEITNNNINKEICYFDNLINIPNSNSIIEICAKTTAKYLLMDYINIYFA